MSEAARIGAQLVVLPSSVWRAELAAELVRLGIDAKQAPRSAGKVLHRIVGHHGWPRASYQVADDPTNDQVDTGPVAYEAET